MERMMALYRDEQQRQAQAAFSAALSAAQAEMVKVIPKGNNPQTKSKYAKYAQLDGMLRPIYLRHGFSLSFDNEPIIGAESAVPILTVLCHVSHVGGYTRTYRAPIPADGKGIGGNAAMTKTHAVGSAMTYGMRYLLKQIFNVAIGEDDDDGNSASVSAGDREIADPIYDKIDLCETADELRAIKSEVEVAKVSAPTKRNLASHYTTRLRKLKGQA
jgi:hypothetical protein